MGHRFPKPDANRSHHHRTDGSGPEKTGGGGAGIQYDSTSYADAGAGGSGVVFLHYPDNRTLTPASGVTLTETDKGNGFKVAEITGAGNVSFT